MCAGHHMHAYDMLISRYVYVVVMPAKCMRARRTAVVYASSESERLWCLGSTGRGNQRWRTGSYLSRDRIARTCARRRGRTHGVDRISNVTPTSSALVGARARPRRTRAPTARAYLDTGPGQIPAAVAASRPHPLPPRCPAPRGWPPRRRPRTKATDRARPRPAPRPATACEYSGRLAGWSGTNQLTHTTNKEHDTRSSVACKVSQHPQNMDRFQSVP
jgi:hypothetical protein